MHDNDLRHQPEVRALAETLGVVGACGITTIIWECVCEYGDDEFHLPLKGKFDLKFWQREFGLPVKDSWAQTRLLLQNASAAGVIDSDALAHGVVWAPELRLRLAEYERQVLKAKAKRAKETAATGNAGEPPVTPR